MKTSCLRGHCQRESALSIHTGHAADDPGSARHLLLLHQATPAHERGETHQAVGHSHLKVYLQPVGRVACERLLAGQAVQYFVRREGLQDGQAGEGLGLAAELVGGGTDVTPYWLPLRFGSGRFREYL
jgi:hypothetical protein